MPIGEMQVRSLVPSDLDALVRRANNPKIAAQLRDRFPHPYTEEAGRAFLAMATERRPETVFAIATDEELIGVLGLDVQPDVHRLSAEMGYWLAEDYWGRGIATAAVSAVTNWGFDELGLVRVFAGVYETNPASVRVLEKAGYELEGRLRCSVLKHGRVLDQFLFARVRDPRA